MANLNNGGQGNNNRGGQNQHDGQKNYSHSNERNRDNIRDNTRDRQYKEHDETLTNDENYDVNTQKAKKEMDFRDTNENFEGGNSDDQKSE